MASDEEPPPLSLRLGLGRSSACCLPPSAPEDLHYVCSGIQLTLPELQGGGHGLLVDAVALSLGPSPGLGIYLSG